MMLQQGLALHQQGRLDQAEQHYRSVLKNHRNHPEALQLLGMLSVAKQQFKEAMAYFNASLKVNDAQPHVWFNLGKLHYDMQRYDKALDAFDRVLALRPDHIAGILHKAYSYKDLGKWGEADELLQSAATRMPQEVQLPLTRATFHRMQGRKDQALALYREAVETEATNAEAWYNIALLETEATALHEDMTHMRALLETQEISQQDAIYLQFALTRACEALGDDVQMMAHMHAANRLKRATYNYDHAQATAHFSALKTHFTQEIIQTHHLTESPSNICPIFVVGMPRSGTTLIEQILAGHSQVTAGGELSLLSGVIMRHAPDYVHKRVWQSPEILQAMRKDYLAGLKKIGNTAYVTDKMPMHFMHLGLIRLILPEAKIIHMVRDPLDTCFSIYKRLFMAPHPYAYDQEELALYYKDYEALMRHWEDVLPGAIIRQSYETLVSEGEEAIQQLIAACGLEWQETCARFYEVKGAVNTASAEQVRRPLYRDAIGSAQKVAHGLEPMIAILNRD